MPSHTAHGLGVAILLRMEARLEASSSGRRLHRAAPGMVWIFRHNESAFRARDARLGGLTILRRGRRGPRHDAVAFHE